MKNESIFIKSISRYFDQRRLSKGKSYKVHAKILKLYVFENKISADIKGNVNKFLGTFSTPYYKAQIKFKKQDKDFWLKIINEIYHKDLIECILAHKLSSKLQNNLDFFSILTANAKFNCNCHDRFNCKHLAGMFFYLDEILDVNMLKFFKCFGFKLIYLRSLESPLKNIILHHLSVTRSINLNDYSFDAHNLFKLSLYIKGSNSKIINTLDDFYKS